MHASPGTESDMAASVNTAGYCLSYKGLNGGYHEVNQQSLTVLKGDKSCKDSCHQKSLQIVFAISLLNE